VSTMTTFAFAEHFAYTRKSFWGGPGYSYWMLIVATIFFGFFGLDHFLLRSPLTGVAKFIVNIFGLGLWYFYDLIQILGEKEKVMEHGLTAPLVGPLGIGAGMFTDSQPDAKPSRSPWRYLLYLALVWLPFGLDSLVAGDTNGAMVKFATNLMFFITWPIILVSMGTAIYRAYGDPKGLFKEGVDRPFPYNWFMGSKGHSVLGPTDVPVLKEEQSLIGSLLGVAAPIIQSTVGTVFPTVAPAVEAVATTVKVGANTARGVIEAAREPAITTVKTGSALVQQVPEAIAQVSQVAKNVTGQLQKFTDPAELAKRAVPGLPVIPTTNSLAGSLGATAGTIAAQSLMKGGGSVGGGLDGSNLAMTGLFVGLMAIMAGGTYYAVKRLNLSLPFINRDTNGNRKGQERNDTPPQSHGL
jgi:TM2 domain-containing membrane protein YozV